MKTIIKYVLGTIILCLGILLLYIKFEYTLVADVRESVSAVSDNSDSRSPLEYGTVLFETRGCSGCHSVVDGGPDNLAPNLVNVADIRSKESLRESIKSPNAVIVDGYKSNIMPQFGDILNEDQIAALVTFLSTLKSK